MRTFSHPLGAIPPGQRARVFWPLLIFTLVLMFVMNLVGLPLQTSAAPAGIVSFELAGSVEQIQAMIDAWDETARLYAAFGLGLDYLFMAVYSTTIGLACVWAADALGARGKRRAFAAGYWLAWGQWLAALLDAIENAALTILLLGSIAEPWPQIAWWCAVIKFILILAGLLYAASGAIANRVLKPSLASMADPVHEETRQCNGK